MGKNPSIDDKLDALKDNLDALRAEVNGIKLAAKGTWAVIALLALVYVGTLWWAAESKIAEIARGVFREELQYRRTMSQAGSFNEKTKVSDSPLAFKWTLIKPLNPETSFPDIRVETVTLIPGLSISAKCVDEGQSCLMTLYGDKDTLTALKLPIEAKASITYLDMPSND